jgi:phosphoribosylamine--glycine ligase
MVIVGPEEPLVKGIYNFIKNNDATKNIIVIGPSENAAQLEGSKSFAKRFMERHNIPTASYKEFNKDNFDEGILYIKNHRLPIVLKADGLAGGKGVIICDNHLQAIAEYEMMLQFSKFGEAGNKVVIEAFLTGIEFSVFAITDGKSYKILPIAKDYKRVGEGDTGLNTGGMGAISPVPFVDETLFKKVEERIIKPTIEGFQKEGLLYQGFVFFGLINVHGEPYVIEYNCRLGDPETEAVLPRLQNDLAEVLQELAAGNLENVTISIDERHAATIVAISGGYPNYYNTGYVISGIKESCTEKSTVFVAGAKMENESYITNGGRVLAVTSLGNSLQEAVTKSKETLAQLEFEDMYYRKDIGYEFLN